MFFMMKNIPLLASAALALACSFSASAQEQLLAFPGAEGFGRYATGGRAGSVYHVTNLDDSGAGSFRDAVSQPNRIIVFDVAGIIYLQSAVTFSDNLTIAGQTAPGDGITLYGNRIAISGKENIICRYLRVRYGMNGEDGKDAAGVSDASHDLIFDHMSITWGRDENFSINSTTAKNITIQNSIIGQGLQNHSCGGLMQTDKENGVTIFRNLYIDNKTRNPKVKGLNQFVNNVVYNWGSGACYNMGGESEGESLTEIRNNYFVKGPCVNYQNVAQDDGSIAYGLLVAMSPTPPFTGGNANFSSYCVANIYDGNKDGALNGVEITQDNWSDICTGSPTFLSEVPDAMPEISSMSSAADAYDWIVANVGASLPIRDEVDDYLIAELSSLGTLGTIIQSEQNTTQFPLGGPGEIRKGTRLADSDNDGMPDVWEDANGTDKSVDDAMSIASNGYANIENYINSISEAQPFFAGPGKLLAEVATDSVALSWNDRNDSETAYVIEISADGGDSWTPTTLSANSTSFTYTSLTPGSYYDFRIMAVSESDSSFYSDVLSVKTKNVPALPFKPTAVTPTEGMTLGLAEPSTYKFQWACDVDEDSGETRFVVYVGTSADNLVAEYGGKSIGITYRNIKLEPGYTYYWRVDAVNEQGTTTGDLWSFSTVQLVENEPVMYLSADDCLSNTAAVALAYAQNGTVVDAVASDWTPSFEAGHQGNAINFPADSDHKGITVPYYSELTFSGDSNTDAEASFSFSLWFKSDGKFLNDKAYLFHKGSFSGSAGWCGIEARGSVLYFVIKSNSKKTELKAITSSTEVSYDAVFNNQWHHLVFVRAHEDKYLYAYCDGVLVNSTACERGFMSSQYGITFGNSQEPSANDEPFAGLMDEMKVYHGALSAAEVKNVYESGLTLGASSSADANALPQVASGRQPVSVLFYNLQGQKVSENAKGVVVKVVSFSDGSVEQSKILN